MSRESDIHAMRTTGIVGCFAFDSELWAACTRLATDTRAPMALRLEALKRIDDITGEEGKVDELALAAFCREVAE